MTNRLPVVGKRYKDKSGLVFKLKAHSVIRSDYPDWWTEFCFEEMKISCPLRHFFENFEELPEDKAETKPEIGQTYIAIKGDAALFKVELIKEDRVVGFLGRGRNNADLCDELHEELLWDFWNNFWISLWIWALY